MERITEFFDAGQEPLVWLAKILGSYILTWIVTWFVAFVLCRLHFFINHGSILLKVYFAWLLPLVAQAAVLTVLLLFSMQFCQQRQTPFWQCLVYFFPLLITCMSGMTISRSIREGLKAKGV